MTSKQIADRLTGVIPPVVTPFNRRGDIDDGAFRANLERYAASDLSGVLVAGSTGEAAFLTEAERLRLVDLARQIVRPPRLLIAGTGLESTAQTLKLSREAIARGADAVLLLPPAYYKPAMRPPLLEAHFRAVGDSVRRPVMIYSIPQFTGFAMEAAMLARLSRHANIHGIKESSGNFEFDRAILGQVSKRFRVMIGSALVLPDAFELGASGAILSQSTFEPQICSGLYQAWRRGDREMAADLQRRLRILAERITGPYSVPGVKHAMDLSGYCGGSPRQPFLPLLPAARKQIAAALKEARDGLTV